MNSIERYADEISMANAILKWGTVRRASRYISCSPSYIYDKMIGDWIYFFALEDRVKIGYTASLCERARAYRLHAGGFGGFVVLLYGTEDDEQKIHRALSEHCIVGEWFYLNESVSSYIKGL